MKYRLNTWLATTATMLIAALLAACGSSSSSSDAGEKTIRIGNTAEVGTLDPQLVSGNWENFVVAQLFEGLVSQDAKGQITPGIAKSWDVSEDGKTYTFHIRDGVKWSDGSPITAHDAVFAWKRLIDPALASKYAAYFSGVVVGADGQDPSKLGVKAIDDQTFEVKLVTPAPYFANMLVVSPAFPVPAKDVKENGDHWTRPGKIVTSGAYKLAEYSPNDHMTLAKNENFHDVDQIKIDKALIYPITDTRTGMNRFFSKEINIFLDYDPERRKELEAKYGSQVHTAPLLGTYFYVFNLNYDKTKKFQDPRVRKAINMAIDRFVVKKTADPEARKEDVAYSYVPPGTANYEYAPEGEQKPIFSFANLSMEERVKQARELMKAAGYGPDKPLSIEISYNTLESHKKVAVAMASFLSKIYIKPVLKNTDVNTHYGNMATGDFELSRAGWTADFDDPMGMLALAGGAFSKLYGGYKNPEVTQLFAKASLENDLKARAKILRKIEEIVIGRDNIFVPLYYYTSRNLVSDKVTGFEDNVDNVHLIRYMDIK